MLLWWVQRMKSSFASVEQCSPAFNLLHALPRLNHPTTTVSDVTDTKADVLPPIPNPYNPPTQARSARQYPALFYQGKVKSMCRSPNLTPQQPPPTTRVPPGGFEFLKELLATDEENRLLSLAAETPLGSCAIAWKEDENSPTVTCFRHRKHSAKAGQIENRAQFRCGPSERASTAHRRGHREGVQASSG